MNVSKPINCECQQPQTGNAVCENSPQQQGAATSLDSSLAGGKGIDLLVVVGGGGGGGKEERRKGGKEEEEEEEEKEEEEEEEEEGVRRGERFVVWCNSPPSLLLFGNSFGKPSAGGT